MLTYLVNKLFWCYIWSGEIFHQTNFLNMIVIVNLLLERHTYEEITNEFGEKEEVLKVETKFSDDYYLSLNDVSFVGKSTDEPESNCVIGVNGERLFIKQDFDEIHALWVRCKSTNNFHTFN